MKICKIECVDSNLIEVCALQSIGKGVNQCREAGVCWFEPQRVSFLRKYFCPSKILGFFLFRSLTGSNMRKPGNIDENTKKIDAETKFGLLKG